MIAKKYHCQDNIGKMLFTIDTHVYSSLLGRSTIVSMAIAFKIKQGICLNADVNVLLLLKSFET